MHAYHHPGRIRRDKLWIGWLVHLKNSGDPGKSYGLEFVEGLWVEKLVHAGSFGSALMLIPTILWPLRGGELGIVFTVLSFVQSWISGESRLSQRFKLLRFALMLWYQSFSRSSQSTTPQSSQSFEGNGAV